MFFLQCLVSFRSTLLPRGQLICAAFAFSGDHRRHSFSCWSSTAASSSAPRFPLQFTLTEAEINFIRTLGWWHNCGGKRDPLQYERSVSRQWSTNIGMKGFSWVWFRDNKFSASRSCRAILSLVHFRPN